MSHLSADTKHHILLEYAAGDAARSFDALAERHSVKGGRDVVRRWHQKWNGTPASLQRKAGSGKKRILSSAQVSRHVRVPLLAANRAHRSVHYTQLLPTVRQKTGKQLSIQTLRRYGKEQLGAKEKHTKKRTAQECKCKTKGERQRACLLVAHRS